MRSNRGPINKHMLLAATGTRQLVEYRVGNLNLAMNTSVG